jgi:hypothetical protein
MTSNFLAYIPHHSRLCVMAPGEPIGYGEIHLLAENLGISSGIVFIYADNERACTAGADDNAGVFPEVHGHRRLECEASHAAGA